MEQINAGILKLMSNPSTFVVGKKTDFGANREPSFDVLLEQKSSQSGSKVVSDRSRKPDTYEKKSGEEAVSEKKEPSSEKTEEENYDLAREVAAGQIIWTVDPALSERLAGLKISEKQADVVIIEQPVIIDINEEISSTTDENGIKQTVGNIPLIGAETGEEVVAEGEAEAMIGQSAEVAQETELPQMETGVSEQKSEEPGIEIRVTKNESEDVSGEAAVAEKPLFKDVETAPIKVAEAPEGTEKAPEIEKQVTEKLTHGLENGETKVEIQLEPVELGKLTIELTRTEDGTLSILFNAENSQTRDLLERHVGGLQEALAERGQQSVQITVNQNEESQRQESYDQRNDFQDGSNGQQNEQRHRDNQRTGDDFLQQLRLGLIPIEEEEEDK